MIHIDQDVIALGVATASFALLCTNGLLNAIPGNVKLSDSKSIFRRTEDEILDDLAEEKDHEATHPAKSRWLPLASVPELYISYCWNGAVSLGYIWLSLISSRCLGERSAVQPEAGLM